MKLVPSILCSLLLCVLISQSFATVSQHFTTTSRNLYTSTGQCDDCSCWSLSVTAYEQSTRQVGQGAHGAHGAQSQTDPPLYLYSSFSYNNWCTGAWSGSWVSQETPLSGLFIHPSNKNGRLSVDGLVDSNNMTVNIDLVFSDVEASSSCNCRSDDFGGPYVYKSTSRSLSERANVNGQFVIGGDVFNLVDVPGYIYSAGSKTVYLSHP